MASASVDRVAEWIARLQQKKIFSLERLRTARSYLFRSIGLIVLIYCFISFLMFLLSMIKSLVRSFFYLCYFPWLLKESYLSKSLPFYLYFPLISTLSALISWCLIKSSSSRIVSFYERSFIKHYPSVDHRQVKVYLYPSLWLILSTFLFLSFTILPFGQVQKDLSSFSSKENRVDQSEMFSSNIHQDRSMTKDDLTIDPMPLEGKSRKDRSSFYAAYTDLACYDYRPLISSDVNPVKKHLIFLNTYRLHSPFPVYLSILQSNGPQCYEEIDQSSCATSKLVLPFYPRLFSIILILSIIAIGVLLHRRRTISSSSSSSTTETIRKPIDETLEKQFRQWFDQHDHVEHLRQACREALNHVLTKTDEMLSIETIQFNNARVHHVFEDPNVNQVKKLLIHGILELEHLLFHLHNRSNGEYTSIDIGRFTGSFRMTLLIDDDHYRMEMNLEKIELNSVEMIDQEQNVSNKQKKEQSLIELLRATICQTIVPCSLHLTDDQNNRITSNELFLATTFDSPSESDPIIVENSMEKISIPTSPSADPIVEPPINSKAMKKKLLVSIVKAVKLHGQNRFVSFVKEQQTEMRFFCIDVEQPFCLLQLNEPKQCHQTSLAKNGVNPFWDERFIFDWNEHSDELHLQIFDRTKNRKKKNLHPNDRLLADISIPLAFLITNNEQKDIPISPCHPDSIVRLKFDIITVEDESLTDSAIEHDYPQSRTDEIVALPLHQQMDTRDDQSQSEQSDVASSLLCSLKHFKFSRDKHHSKTNHSVISSTVSATPSIAQSFRNLFRSKSKKNKTPQLIQTGNFLLDHHDLPSTSTPVQKKRSFFQRHRSKNKTKKTDPINLSANSLDSYDCPRVDSARNTPIRANVGHPVTMTKSTVR